MNVCKIRFCVECFIQWFQFVVKGYYYYIFFCYEDFRILVRGFYYVFFIMDKYYYRVQCGVVIWDFFCILNKIKLRNRYIFVCTVYVFYYFIKFELKNMLQMKIILKILTIKLNVFVFFIFGVKIFMQRQFSFILVFFMFGIVFFIYYRCCGYVGLYVVVFYIFF